MAIAKENKTKEIPKTEEKKIKELPEINKTENSVIIAGEVIEIKPTKLRYQRNRTANFYKVFELYGLPEILSWEVGQLGEEDERDGDRAVLEWLMAVFDGDERIKEHYDEMDTEDIENIVKIFKRVNHINEKEEARKNALREKIQG